MEIIKISMLVLVSVVLINSIPTHSKEISIFTTFACCTVVLLYILQQIVPAIEYIKSIANNVTFNNLDIIIKAVGVGFITQFVSDTALDFNNKTLSNQMIFAGKVCIFLLAMPVFLEIFKIVEQLT